MLVLVLRGANSHLNGEPGALSYVMVRFREKEPEQTVLFVAFLLRWEFVCADKFPFGVTSVILDSSGGVAVVES